MYYTYAYLREDGTPYYIGKGHKYRINEKGKYVKTPPKDRRIYLKTELTEEEAFRHEIYMIAVLGRKDLGTGILRNVSNGGEGTSGYKFTEEQKERLRQRPKHKPNLGKKREGEWAKNWWNAVANEYIVTYKDGREETIKGLRKWMKDNNYDPGGINRVKNGKLRSYKGIVKIEKI